MRKSIIRRYKEPAEIPTASTADIAFLLILFFMVTTVFRATTLHLKIKLPEATSTERILIRRNISYVWVDVNSKIYIDDHIVSSEMIGGKMTQKVWDNPELIAVLKVDEMVRFGVVDGILDQLKLAKAFRITFASERRK
ncbi:biopolymer transporter ExbD [candidate division WOR-3 bacterium]|nr:biopolymer transporter ExbD [candidate division WOR-3 bacterium]